MAIHAVAPRQELLARIASAANFAIERHRRRCGYLDVGRVRVRQTVRHTASGPFDAWQRAGMSMGSLYEVSMLVEGYQSSGTADVSFSME